jgi:hypothetical protein
MVLICYRPKFSMKIVDCSKLKMISSIPTEMSISTEVGLYRYLQTLN